MPEVNQQAAATATTAPVSTGNDGGAANLAPPPVANASLSGGSTPSPAAAATPPASEAPPGVTPPAGEAPDVAKWRETLPDDLKGEKSLQNYKSVEDLARSLVHAQKLIGRDNKVIVPDPKTASEKDYQDIYKKLGLPEDVKDYKMELAADSGLDSGFIEQIKGKAHEMGILPKQLEKLLSWYSGESKQVMTQHQEEVKKAYQQSHVDLKNEWGKAYDKNVLAAQLAVKDGATPEEVKYLESKGLATDTTLLRIFSRLGNKFKEAEIKGGTSSKDNFLAPAQAKVEAEKIISDMKGPYHNSSHPGHATAVEQVKHLMEQAYPEPSEK